jgi:hypothetical protein
MINPENMTGHNQTTLFCRPRNNPARQKPHTQASHPPLENVKNTRIKAITQKEYNK